MDSVFISAFAQEFSIPLNVIHDIDIGLQFFYDLVFVSLFLILIFVTSIMGIDSMVN